LNANEYLCIHTNFRVDLNINLIICLVIFPLSILLVSISGHLFTFKWLSSLFLRY